MPRALIFTILGDKAGLEGLLQPSNWDWRGSFVSCVVSYLLGPGPLLRSLEHVQRLQLLQRRGYLKDNHLEESARQQYQSTNHSKQYKSEFVTFGYFQILKCFDLQLLDHTVM